MIVVRTYERQRIFDPRLLSQRNFKNDRLVSSNVVDFSRECESQFGLFERQRTDAELLNLRDFSVNPAGTTP